LNTSKRRGTNNRQTKVGVLEKQECVQHSIVPRLFRLSSLHATHWPKAGDALAQGRSVSNEERIVNNLDVGTGWTLTLYTGMGLTTTQQPAQRPPGSTASAVSLSKLTKTMRNKSLDETMSDLVGTAAAHTCVASTSRLFVDVLANGLSQLLHHSSGSNGT